MIKLLDRVENIVAKEQHFLIMDTFCFYHNAINSFYNVTISFYVLRFVYGFANKFSKSSAAELCKWDRVNLFYDC